MAARAPVDARIGTLRTAQAELHDPAARRRADLCGFGGDERLVIDKGQKRRFDELRLEHGRHDGDDGLVRKDDLPFAHRVHVARKAQFGEVREIVLREHVERTEIGDIALVEVQVFQIVRRLIEPRGDRIGDEAVGTEEDIEHRLLRVLSPRKISLTHRELIQVGKQGEVPHASPPPSSGFSSSDAPAGASSTAPEGAPPTSPFFFLGGAGGYLSPNILIVE